MDPRTGPSPSRPVNRMFAAWLAGSALAALLILANSRGDVREMAFGDGLIARYVAANLSIEPEDVDTVVSERGTSLRYGRIGMPAAIWVASGGQPRAMRYTHPAVVVVAAGAVSAAAAALLPAAWPLAPVIPFIAPGLPLSIIGGYAEVLGAALALWGVAMAARHRWGWSAVQLSGAILTRENAGAVLLGLLLWHGVVKRRARSLILLAAGIPTLAWYLVVRARFGHLPVLDPYLRAETDTIGAPLVAVWRSLTTGGGASIATAAVHVCLAVAAAVLWRRSALGMIAAVAALQIAFAGPFAWRFPGDAVRASIILELFVLLALARVRWVDRAGPTGLPDQAS